MSNDLVNPDPATRRTAATALAAMGAALVFSAAGVFIAVRWEQMGLESKAAIIAGLALASLAGGRRLRPRLPGVAVVLSHLGAFLLPLDIGGVATAMGASRPVVGVVGGLSGLIVLSMLDRTRSPVMSLGRVLSAGGVGLGAGALLELPAASLVIAIGLAALVIDRRSDALGLAALAGLGPLFAWAGRLARPDSLVDWLGEQAATTPIQTVAAAVAAASIALASGRHTVVAPAPPDGSRNRLRPEISLVVALAVSVLASPDATALIGQHQAVTVVLAAATVLALRVLALRLPHCDSGPVIDGLALAVASLTALYGLSAQLGTPNLVFMPAMLWAAAMLTASWLVADVDHGRRNDPGTRAARSLWRGDSGKLSTVGLMTSFTVACLATGDMAIAALLLAAASTVIGISARPGARTTARIGLPLAVLVASGEPVTLVVVGIVAAVVLQARAILDLPAGPRRARLTQLAGVASLATALFGFTIQQRAGSLVPALMASSAAATTLVMLALSSDRLRVPDLGPAPRVALTFSVLPLLSTTTLAGTWLVGIGALLFLDLFLDLSRHGLPARQPQLEMLASCALVLGSWMICGGTRVDVLEGWMLAPTVLLAGFGIRAMRDGASSWHGLAPAVTLLGVSAFLERIGGGGGWHAVVAGTLGLVALGVGVERRWAGPSVIGTVLLSATVIIEASGAIPRLPVWMLLAVGGAILLGAGALLERRQGVGTRSTVAAAWAEFH